MRTVAVQLGEGPGPDALGQGSHGDIHTHAPLTDVINPQPIPVLTETHQAGA